MIDFFSRVYFHSHCRRVALLKLAEEEKIHKRESRGDDDSSISDARERTLSLSFSLCAIKIHNRRENCTRKGCLAFF